ncbi:MAG TPA: hypothetical protein VF194_04145 [Ferrovibrio sp.]|uniref:hypothetical protein n=1 Tax=Ferrovibrio sp. TaxID=1917215 RepID=UPI002ED2E1DC
MALTLSVEVDRSAGILSARDAVPGNKDGAGPMGWDFEFCGPFGGPTGSRGNIAAASGYRLN